MEPKKHYFAHIPTIAIFIAFAISGPLGLLLFILKSIDKKSEKEEQARNGWGTASRQAAARSAPDRETIYGPDVPTREQQDAKERHNFLTFLCTLGGVDRKSVV